MVEYDDDDEVKPLQSCCVCRVPTSDVLTNVPICAICKPLAKGRVLPSIQAYETREFILKQRGLTALTEDKVQLLKIELRDALARAEEHYGRLQEIRHALRVLSKFSG